MLEYFVPIQEKQSEDGEFLIRGVAINETTTSNGHKFIANELEKAAGSLIGKPLLKDHENMVDNIVGRVKESKFDSKKKNIPFSAVVKDEKMIQMIKDGLINSVSVGAGVDPDDIEEDEDGTIIPHNIEFFELSLVAVPADSGATFGVALKQALLNSAKTNQSQSTKSVDNVKCIERGINQQTMTEQEEAKPQETSEPKPEETSQEEPKEEKSEENLEVSETLKAMQKQMADMAATIAELSKPKVEEADKDEEKPKESEESEEDEEEDEIEEKADYKIVQGHNSFSVVRNRY